MKYKLIINSQCFNFLIMCELHYWKVSSKLIGLQVVPYMYEFQQKSPPPSYSDD